MFYMHMSFAQSYFHFMLIIFLVLIPLCKNICLICLRDKGENFYLYEDTKRCNHGILKTVTTSWG